MYQNNLRSIILIEKKVIAVCLIKLPFIDNLKYDFYHIFLKKVGFVIIKSNFTLQLILNTIFFYFINICGVLKISS